VRSLIAGSGPFHKSGLGEFAWMTYQMRRIAQ
jgi:hypothetical protein